MNGFSVLLALCALGAGGGALQAADGARISATVLDQDGRPIEDAVVFVAKTAEASFPAPLHPVVMDQVDKEFNPHLLPVMVGSKVRFPNKDDIHHHLYSFSPAKAIDLPLYKGEPAEPILFDKEGVVKLGCNIHDWMSGIILVLPNPYFAKTDASGKALLSVPAGAKAELAVFFERLKGSVDDTRKTVSLAKGSASPTWRLAVKRAAPAKRPAVGYP